jgi:hypothetical protein
VTYEAFEARARALWDEIPDSYREGVDGLVVERNARAHATLADVYTLGECLTETYPSEFGGPETLRSLVVLYYGSFWRLARLDPAFDWEGELWETLTHELQHHLESLATEAGLEELDYAANENFKRAQEEPFDPLFFRSGESLGDGWYRIEDEYFLETAEPAKAGRLEFDWRGDVYAARIPESDVDVLFLEVSGVPDPAPVLTLVRVRAQRLGERIRRLLRGAALSSETVEVEAEPVRREELR